MIVWSRIVQVSSTEYGALVVRNGGSPQRGKGKVVTARDQSLKEFYADGVPYESEGGEVVIAAVFPALVPGNYSITDFGGSFYGTVKKITVFPGAVAEAMF